MNIALLRIKSGEGPCCWRFKKKNNIGFDIEVPDFTRKEERLNTIVPIDVSPLSIVSEKGVFEKREIGGKGSS